MGAGSGTVGHGNDFNVLSNLFLEVNPPHAYSILTSISVAFPLFV